MKTRTTIITMALAAGALAVSAAPAMAASHAPFVVQDMGGAMVTQQSVTVGEVVHTAGQAYTVATVHGVGKSFAITFSQRLPACDHGKAILFTT